VRNPLADHAEGTRPWTGILGRGSGQVNAEAG
jgi:hypothetical protein